MYHTLYKSLFERMKEEASFAVNMQHIMLSLSANIVQSSPHGFPAFMYTQSFYFLTADWPGTTTSLKGYFSSSSFLIKCFLLFLVTTCSTIISLAISFMYFLMKRGSQSSEAMPRSLQQRIRALDLQPSVAVGIPSGSKYCCSPRAIETSLGYD